MGHEISDKDRHNHAERYVYAENKWISIEDFPTEIMSNNKYNAVHGAPIVFHVDAYYVFGGRWETQTKRNERPKLSRTSDEIIRLDHATSKWSKVGTMNTARELHRVIYDGTVFLVVG